MLRRELATSLLSRIAVDVERSSSVLVCNREQLMFGEGIPSGAWGLALSFGELAQVDSQPRWQALARHLATIECGGLGAGLFGGYEGQWAALAAVGVSSELSNTRSSPRGDLMNGGAGIAWAHRCRGEVGVRTGVGASDEAGTPPRRAGLAHGELGIVAAYGGADGEGSVERLRELKAGLSQAGWCNGISGVAVAALLVAQPNAESEHFKLAREIVLESLAMPRLETDGLCHGDMGVLVVGAAVARLSDDSELKEKVDSAADAICRRSQREGWRLETSRTADQSWLTGVAGIAWALLVLDSRPVVNPLCPIDSVLAQP